MFFPFNLESQPNGGLTENCLTTFNTKKDDNPKWYDRPCVETKDFYGELGHRFMCECTAPYLHDPDQNQNAQGNILFKFVRNSGWFHLHLLVFPFVYQFNYRLGVIVHSSFANE